MTRGDERRPGALDTIGARERHPCVRAAPQLCEGARKRRRVARRADLDRRNDERLGSLLAQQRGRASGLLASASDEHTFSE